MHAKKILARSVEVNLTAHCNLSCYGCDHVSPVHEEEYLSVEELTKDLGALAEVYHVFEFLLTGGEPLLHPHLLNIVDTIRASGIADKITLITNGVLLHNAPEALWSKIDKLGVSIYPGVKRRLSQDDIKALADRHRLLLWYKPTDDFTIRLIHSENSNRDLVKAIYSTCTLRNSCHTIHKGRYFKCSPSPFVPDWLRRVRIDAFNFERDSVAVRNNPDLRQQLADYLKDEEPLTACRYCLGSVGKSMPLRQMNKVAAQQWLAEKDDDVSALIDWDALRKAQRRPERTDLNGMLATLAGRRMRWRITPWFRRALGIDLIGAPPTAIWKRTRRLFSPWLIPMRGGPRRPANQQANDPRSDPS